MKVRRLYNELIAAAMRALRDDLLNDLAAADKALGEVEENLEAWRSFVEDRRQRERIDFVKSNVPPEDRNG